MFALFKAVVLPPARYFGSKEGALPEARRLFTPMSRELLMVVRVFQQHLYIRCCIHIRLGRDGGTIGGGFGSGMANSKEDARQYIFINTGCFTFKENCL